MSSETIRMVINTKRPSTYLRIIFLLVVGNGKNWLLTSLPKFEHSRKSCSDFDQLVSGVTKK